MKGKDFLTLAEFTPQDLESVLDVATRLKARRDAGLGSSALRGKSVALVFEKPSLRTRTSFQVAVSELGGFSMNLSANELQLGRGETVEDTARVLSRYVHCIMARVNRHGDLERLAKAARVPVINGLSDLHHPVQILADLLTLRERKGRLRGLKVGWVGDGDNVCNSWSVGAALTGIHFTAATPKGYEPAEDVAAMASKMARETGGSVTVTADPFEAVSDADCVITDTFVSMGFEKEQQQRLKAFMPKYRVTKALMARAKKDAVFEHCLPAHRGEEMDADVIDGPQSVVFDEAENRLHTEKALLCFLMLGKREFSSLMP
ncbi:MAG: ornithine carbamoyltransferase [Nitrososphaerota archaeon]|nr:ornithine carbamoyltransferase [Nitrososphaerota archaeon]MDG7024066.1 ornithine carbamoyltransferase [Nitrososphaerota archaeon]